MSSTIGEKLLQIRQLCEKTLTSSDDPILKQVRDKCSCSSNILENSQNVTDDEVKEQLKLYAQIVLDFTYSDECKLVEQEFPEASSKDRVHEIFFWIDTIEELKNRYLPSISIIETLGHEIVECVYWRKGALLYMLCNMIHENDGRKKEINDEFFEDVKQGIQLLQQMLSVRNSNIKWEGEQTVVDLANMGIYSDTHLLGMMYAGEMCYWYCEKADRTANDFDAKAIGKDFLTKYIQTVKSPLMFGWSTEKAEEFLKSLSS